MGRKPSNVVNAEINRLRRVLESTVKSDIELMEELQIKKTTFYRYKEAIRQQDIAAWHEIAKETQEEALLKIKKALDYATKVYQDIIDHAPDHRARLEAAKQIIQNTVWAKQLLEKGPRVLPKIEAKVIEQTEAMEPIRQSAIS